MKSIRILVIALMVLLGCLNYGDTAGAQVRVVNSGVPGQNSSDVRGRFRTSLESTHPNYVVLFVGMNDAVNDRKFLAPEESLRNILSMIREARVSGVSVILVNVHAPDYVRLLKRHLLADYGSKSPDSRIKEINAVIAEAAKTEGVRLVDFNKILGTAGGANEKLSPDGVHLYPEGYSMLAHAVRQALPEKLSAQTVILCMGDSLTFGIGARSAGSPEEGNQTYPVQLRALLNP